MSATQLPGRALLRWATRWFDAATVARVFEPMIADWQREWQESPSPLARVRIFASGAMAFALSAAICVLTGATAMPRVAFFLTSAVLALSTILLVAIQAGMNALQFRNDFPIEMRIWMALPPVLPLAVPLAMLPAMMLVRGARRVASGGAAAFICAGALVAYVTAGWLTPLAQGDISDDLYEEMHARTVAADAAGRVTYPGTAVRQLKPTTPEQRAALREGMRRNPQYAAWQAERTRPRWGRPTVMVAALALAMGALGWALGALGRTRAIHAAAWWALACATLLVLDGRVMFSVDRTAVRLGRAPYWAPLALFTVAAIAAWLSTRHRPLGTRGTVRTQGTNASL